MLVYSIDSNLLASIGKYCPIMKLLLTVRDWHWKKIDLLNSWPCWGIRQDPNQSLLLGEGLLTAQCFLFWRMAPQLWNNSSSSSVTQLVVQDGASGGEDNESWMALTKGCRLSWMAVDYFFSVFKFNREIRQEKISNVKQLMKRVHQIFLKEVLTHSTWRRAKTQIYQQKIFAF